MASSSTDDKMASSSTQGKMASSSTQEPPAKRKLDTALAEDADTAEGLESHAKYWRLNSPVVSGTGEAPDEAVRRSSGGDEALAAISEGDETSEGAISDWDLDPPGREGCKSSEQFRCLGKPSDSLRTLRLPLAGSYCDSCIKTLMACDARPDKFVFRD